MGILEQLRDAKMLGFPLVSEGFKSHRGILEQLRDAKMLGFHMVSE